MASEIRVNKINSRTGVGTITLSPTGVDFTGIATASTLRATTGIITTLQVGTISGDGSSLTGIAATDNVRTGILDVAGVGTFRNDVNIPDKIIHLGDTDTAIRFPAADTITAETGGSERLRITSAARFGFNTANPPRDYCFHSGQADTNIQITNNTTGVDDSAGSLIQQDGNDLYIWNKENSFMSLGTNAAERVRISSGGDATFKYKVTIGNSYAGGEILSLGKSSGTSYIAFQNGGANMGFIGYADQLISGGASNELGIRSQDDILFSSGGNTERLRISTSAAAVHVKGESALTGTTGDAKGLSLGVNGSASCPLYFGTETHSAQKSMYLSGYWIYLRGHSNEGIRFVFSQGSGTAPRSDQYQFKYNQATRPTGNTTWDGFSDRRAKENVQDVTSALDTIGRLRPVTFDWTNDYADRMNMFNMDKSDPKSYNWFSVKENGYDETRKNNNVGFIAQEFEEVFPKDITETEMELGGETITDFKTVNFDSLVPMLTKAVQELKAENDSLKARLDAAGL